MKDKNPVGRPKIKLSDLPKDWKNIVLDLAKVGASDVEIRCRLNCICHETWTRLIEEHYEFSETIKKAVVLCESWWQVEGRISLRDTKFSPVLWYMNMKNRFGWKDKTEVDGKVVVESSIVYLPPKGVKE